MEMRMGKKEYNFLFFIPEASIFSLLRKSSTFSIASDGTFAVVFLSRFKFTLSIDFSLHPFDIQWSNLFLN